MNSEEVVTWRKQCNVMVAFVAKIGSTASYKVQTYEVVMDWVLVTFEPQLIGSLETVERASGLVAAVIVEARWIKPTHLRVPGQRTALAIFGFATCEATNHAIEFGLFIEGKKVWAQKQLQQPRRCLKCQCFGGHKAATCGSAYGICGRCRGQHRTSDCQEENQNMFECSNCRIAKNGKHRGHDAADRRCPIFLAQVDRVNQLCRDNTYKYFCMTEPRTWEMHSGPGNTHRSSPDATRTWQAEGHLLFH